VRDWESRLPFATKSSGGEARTTAAAGHGSQHPAPDQLAPRPARHLSAVLKEEALSSEWMITIDLTRCRGTGLCVAFAPENFELGHNHQSRPRLAKVAADPVVIDAATCCPTEAITVINVATGEKIFPDG
jgi:ferredoxin